MHQPTRALFLAATFAMSVLLLMMMSHSPLHSQESKPVLTLENGGLKNLYRVIFHEWDEANHFARGVVEVQGQDSSEADVRMPFAVEVKPGKDKKVETLEVRATGGLFFFAPADKKEPYPPLTWTLTGRKGGKPVLKAKLWTYDGDKETWVLEEMTLVVDGG